MVMPVKNGAKPMPIEKRSSDEIALAVLKHWREDFPDAKMSAHAAAEFLRRVSAAIENNKK